MKRLLACLLPLVLLSPYTLAENAKPNILVIFADDVGQTNLSIYSRGLMGYRTPNIDRIAHEGATFTDYYGEQSCTAGRAAFITGQYAVRVGLPKVGLVGSPQGLSEKDPTIAQMLKPLGYATGQFGKNHLGDRNEFLPTVHGFDEFYGNLYHLNTHTEMEDEDYPKNKEFIEKFGPRGVIHSFASEKDDATTDPRFGRVGKQKVEDTGPLDSKRIPDVDREYVDNAKRFIRDANKAGKPFFTWFAASRMHFPTLLNAQAKGVTGQDIFADGMVEHDKHVGELLTLLDELKIADNTIVIWASDNGPMKMNWPDGGTDPFRSEKGTGWEGAFRVPAVVRWPGVIKPETEFNGLASHHDWFETLYAAASGDGDVASKLRNGMKVGGVDYKVHLDGYNLMPWLSGKVAESPRESFLYFGDDTSLLNMRYKDWKFTFAEQRAKPGTWDLWRDPFVSLRVPRIQNLRRDPFERAQDESVTYGMWVQEKQFMIVPAISYVAEALESFKQFPPRGLPANYSMDKALQMMQTGPSN
jgi:arylsulfatase A-like enzyme